MSPRTPDLRSALRLPAGPVSLDDRDPRATPLAPARAQAEAEMAGLGQQLSAWQERLYAEGLFGGGRRRLLLVLQGTDTSGKDGVVRHVIGAMNPQGCEIASFKRPTSTELRHDFLWRIRKRVPQPGMVGIFNRSHYEDVLIVRVHDLVPEPEWSSRYDAINAFERELVDDDITLVKVFLHLSYDEQRQRLLARLDDPTKRWKFNPGDVAERALWADYRLAYEAALERCSTDSAPWYVVPADRKWYRNWAISRLLLETLSDMHPEYPQPGLDLSGLRARLAPPN